MKYTVAGLFIVAALAVGAYFFPVATQTFGSSSSNESYSWQYFHAGEILGGQQVSSSTSASVTLTGNEFSNPNMTTLYYTINNNAGDTLTLPASTTPMCQTLQKGDSRRFWIVNASTTANTLTIAGSASIYLNSASTTAKIDGSTSGSGMASLTVFKLPSSNCTAMLDSFY